MQQSNQEVFHKYTLRNVLLSQKISLLDLIINLKDKLTFILPMLDGIQDCSYRVASNASTKAILLYEFKHFLVVNKDLKLTEGVDKQLHIIVVLLLK